MKCKWLSLIATFAVVCIHSRTTEWAPGVVDWSSRLQDCLIEHCRFAVPMFFLFSGYWFMKSYEKVGYLELLRKKFWSLYVPFILWCIIGELAVVPSSFYSSTEPAWGKLWGVVFLLTDGLNLAFHLWFVRGLLIFFLLAPLCYLIGQKIYLVLGVILIARLFPAVSFGPYKFDCFAMAVSWFMLGAWLSVKNRLAIRFSKPYVIVGTIASLFCIVAADLLSDLIIAYHVRIVSMIIFFWFGFDWVSDIVETRHMPTACKHTFFIYCVHLAVIRYSGNLLRGLMRDVDADLKVIGYFVNTSSFWIDVVIAEYLSRRCPRVYHVLSGGRD